MRLRNFVLGALLACTSLAHGDVSSLLAPDAHGESGEAARVRFRVTTVEERGEERSVISEASVEGPPGTDFNIDLNGGLYRMRARFLTDLVGRDRLKVRARLDTRRLYGYSERHLPLYEEDAQRQTLELGFDEAVVLLPFGRGGGDHRLKIEIVPQLSERTALLPSGAPRPIEIDLLKPSPGGLINVEAM